MTTEEDGDAPETTQILFGEAARAKMLVGMRMADQAVGSTLGPRGLTVLIAKNGSQTIATKDGVTVSRAIIPIDPFERMGAELIREAASRTNDIAGDGTTTATILTHAMVAESHRLMVAGSSPSLVRTGIERAVSDVVVELQGAARVMSTRDEIIHVGTISANGDKRIGEIVADAMARVGRDGIVTVEDAKGTVTSLDVVEGMRLDRGFLSPYFVTHKDKMHAAYDDAYVMLTDRKLTNLQEIIGILEAVHKEKKPLLIVADEIDGVALQTLIVNKVKSGLDVVAIRAPGFGSMRDAILQDIATLTGAKIASASTGVAVDKLTRQDLGRCKRCVVDSKSTVIVGTGATAEQVKKHAEELRDSTVDPSLSDGERHFIRDRIAKLTSGVAVIRVGGATELEMVERKHRIEDAINATRAAIEEGLVAGGGTALLKASQAVAARAQFPSDVHERAGYELVLRACESPLKRIVANAGCVPELVVERVRAASEQSFGYDASTASYVDMFEAGIVDPVKVCRTAIVHAASVACTFTGLSAAVFGSRRQ